MSYLKDREVWLEKTPTGNPPAEYYWKFIQDGVVVVRDSDGVDKKMVAKTSDTGAAELPSGTSAQRPDSPTAGMIRYNAEVGFIEWYDVVGDNWFPISFFPGVAATGGTVTDIEQDGNLFRIHTFTSDGTFNVTRGGEVEYLVVAGGGAGASGGGGAGGVLFGNESLIGNTYSIVVGNGGNGLPAASGGGPQPGTWRDERGENGGNSSAFDITAIGGGSGGAYGDGGVAVRTGAGGGSGGGGGGLFTNETDTAGGDGTAGQGNNGGRSSSAVNNGAGGGGGAGEAGNNGTSVGGAGGDGVQNDITGTQLFYGGGGSGGSVLSGSGTVAGGLGGGGFGINNSVGDGGTSGDGAPNTGGGGGGTGETSGNGGSGIVIVRYRIG